jgi:hypothetical protein
MSAPTARELSARQLVSLVPSIDATELRLPSLLAARVEAVLALLPAWRDGYCGDLAKLVQRLLDGEEP